MMGRGVLTALALATLLSFPPGALPGLIPSSPWRPAVFVQARCAAVVGFITEAQGMLVGPSTVLRLAGGAGRPRGRSARATAKFTDVAEGAGGSGFGGPDTANLPGDVGDDALGQAPDVKCAGEGDAVVGTDRPPAVKPSKRPASGLSPGGIRGADRRKIRAPKGDAGPRDPAQNGDAEMRAEEDGAQTPTNQEPGYSATVADLVPLLDAIAGGEAEHSDGSDVMREDSVAEQGNFSAGDACQDSDDGSQADATASHEGPAAPGDATAAESAVDAEAAAAEASDAKLIAEAVAEAEEARAALNRAVDAACEDGARDEGAVTKAVETFLLAARYGEPAGFQKGMMYAAELLTKEREGGPAARKVRARLQRRRPPPSPRGRCCCARTERGADGGFGFRG